MNVSGLYTRWEGTESFLPDIRGSVVIHAIFIYIHQLPTEDRRSWTTNICMLKGTKRRYDTPSLSVSSMRSLSIGSGSNKRQEFVESETRLSSANMKTHDMSMLD